MTGSDIRPTRCDDGGGDGEGGWVEYLVRAVHVHVDRREKCVLRGMRVDPADYDEVFR
jgi:hypothetical protein